MAENYYKKFADFCKDNDIWFAVCGNGSVDNATFLPTDANIGFGDQKFGTKAAYDRLVAGHLEGWDLEDIPTNVLKHELASRK